MIGLLKTMARDRTGSTAIEYAVIAGLISLAIIAGATLIGSQLGVMFTDTAGKI